MKKYDNVDELRKKYSSRAKELRKNMEMESQFDYFGYKKKKKYPIQPAPSSSLTKKIVKDTFTNNELLDMVDDDVIQNYLRNKKLKRLKDKLLKK
jgi:hypothetical protein